MFSCTCVLQFPSLPSANKLTLNKLSSPSVELLYTYKKKLHSNNKNRAMTKEVKKSLYYVVLMLCTYLQQQLSNYPVSNHNFDPL